MLRIKEFAQLCGCTIYTLRYYDEIGLLKPNQINKDSGYRYYKHEQVNRYLEIKEFQDIGLSVEDIKQIEGSNNLEISRKILQRMEELQDRLQKSIRLMRRYMEHEQNNSVTMQMEDQL